MRMIAMNTQLTITFFAENPAARKLLEDIFAPLTCAEACTVEVYYHPPQGYVGNFYG